MGVPITTMFRSCEAILRIDFEARSIRKEDNRVLEEES